MMRRADVASKYCIFLDSKILVRKNNDEYSLPDARLGGFDRSTGELIELGVYHDHTCFGLEVSAICFTECQDAVWVPVKQAFELLPAHWFQVVVKSFHLLRWMRQHRYCGQCGAMTVKNPEAFELTCATCALSFYPKISPSVIVMIRKGDEILMARSPHFAEGIYAFIAGYVDPGETLEDAVRREVMEEVGLTVKNIEYFGSQPWPFPDSLMMAFTADYDSGEIEFIDGEIEAADWYDKDNFPGRPSSQFSIASRLLEHFIEGG